jgi:hypothetical protein
MLRLVMQPPGAVGVGAIPTVDFLLSDFEKLGQFDAVKT